MIVLVLGGARSGKSAIAERLAQRLADRRDGSVTYLATGVVSPEDPDFAARVAAHRARRPGSWSTVECGRDLAAALDAATSVALVDALGTWVAAHPDLGADVDEIPAALAKARTRAVDVVVVSDEVGLGVHPETEIGRRFRDVLGMANASVAAVSDAAWFVVAGQVLALTPESAAFDLLWR